MERKVCFISDTGSWWKRVVDACPKVDSAPCPHPCKQRVRVFKAEWGWGGQHAETTQSSRTVFFKLIISGLTSIILVVLDTVSLQFWGPFVPISLWSILGIVVSRVLGIMQLTFPPGHHAVNFSTWCFSVYKTAHRTWLRIFIYSPWERTKGAWLCLMTTLLLFDLLRRFSFVSTFLTSLIKLILLLKFSTSKRQAENMIERQGPYGLALFQN